MQKVKQRQAFDTAFILKSSSCVRYYQYKKPRDYFRKHFFNLKEDAWFFVEDNIKTIYEIY